jgi:hypothetical protein
MIFCEPHEGRYSGVLVAKKLDEVIESMNIPEHCYKAMTTDNAENMRVAFRE